MLLALADSMINLVPSSSSPISVLDGIEIISLYQAWPTEYGTFVQSSPIAPERSSTTKDLKLKVDEIILELKSLMEFGRGTGEGWLSRGASLADVISNPGQINDKLQEKIQYIGTLLQKAGDAYCMHLDDKFTLVTGITEQTRAKAAGTMKHRSERVLSWANAVNKRLQAMSARDWGHVTGEAIFDMCTFNLAGKAAGIVATGLKEARHAELALKCEQAVSQALESVANQIHSTATELAGKAATALEPELATAGTHLKETWGVLKQDAQEFVNKAGKAGQAVKQIRTLQDVIQQYFGSIKEICKTKIKDIQHILDRHIPGGCLEKTKEGTSLFITNKNPLNQAEKNC